MNTRCILFFIFILVLLYILHTNQESYINVKIPNHILKYFSQDDFFKNTENFKITYLEYENKSLDAKSYKNSTINDL